MSRSTQGSRSRPAVWVVGGLVMLLGAGVVLVMLSLGLGPTAPAATETPTVIPPSATPEPSASPTKEPTESAEASTTPVLKPASPTPAPSAEVPDEAPNFTLNRAGGGSFTLSAQLEEGPVVLVFFERCG